MMTTRILDGAGRTGRSPATAARIMTPNPKSINRHATVRETARMLQENGLNIAPVIDDAGRPVGVVSRTDLLDYWSHRRDRLAALAAGEIYATSTRNRVVPGDEVAVQEIMTPVVFGVRANAPITDVVEKLIALKIRYLFVTDRDRVLLGTISVFDVLRHLTRGVAKHTAIQRPNRHLPSRNAQSGLESAIPP